MEVFMTADVGAPAEDRPSNIKNPPSHQKSTIM
jgi:hypothetical protein